MTGHYQLRGVREFTATLDLLRDGRFEYAYAYGGASGAALGRWTLDGITVSLAVDPPPATAFTEGGRGPKLLGDYGDDANKPTLLAVRVSTPRLGLTWSNIEISAEFSNGQVRRGVTNRAGLLGFLQREDEPWAGAIIRRVGVAYSKANVGPTWFPVDASTKGLEVHLEPGPLVPPVFERAALLLAEDVNERVLVVKDGNMAEPGARFVRR